MNHSQYHYKGMDADLDEYLSEYKNQTPLESDHYAGECCNYLSIYNHPSRKHFCYVLIHPNFPEVHYVTQQSSLRALKLPHDECRFFS